MTNQKTWLITGASKGLGLSLVQKALDHGDNVVATSRNVQDLTRSVGPKNNFLPLAADITDEQSVASTIRSTIAAFGRLDILVNNAGYGQVGGLEELSHLEVKRNFDVNVFGSLHFIRQVLPLMREQHSGHIINISSIGGFSGGFPGWGIYCATKFAMHGFTEALAAEVRSFGIHVTDVAPGYFRTNFLSSSSLMAPANPISEYKEVRASQDFHQQDMNGQQPGDPDKAAAVIIKIADADRPPLHLFLGQDAYKEVQQKINGIQKDLDDWREWATATGFNSALS
ncbi:MAG: SDR family NAD(P)-dependent oxidoreductase [Chitinophagaceae bacterium]|nr:SDR family NAD(P)-dependent oxidoreductase [Chitinophagaceae bacterium]